MENLKEVEISGKLKKYKYKQGNTSQKFEGQNSVKKAEVSTYRPW